jgi:O-antigen ligase
MQSYVDLLRIEKLHSLLVLPIIFYSTKNLFKGNNNILTTLSKVFVFSAFISFSLSFLFGLYRMIFSEKNINSIYITYNHLAELFGVQPLYLAVFYLLAIIFCIDLIRSKQPYKKLYRIFGIILFIGIVLLSSRTSLFLSVIIILIKIFANSSTLKIRNTIILFFSIFAVGIVLTFSIPTLKNRVLKFNENVSSYSGISLRTKIWKNTFEVIKDSPIYGHGFGLSQTKLVEQYKKINFRRGFINDYNSHNQYLQTLLDSGILGLVVLLLILTFPFLDFSNIRLTHSLFSIIIIISFIPESFFLRQYGVLFFSLFYSLFYISYDKD